MTSIAAALPIARGRRNSPPAPATRLRLTSASPNDDRVDGDDEIARQHDLAAAGCREAVDGGDHGLRALAKANPAKPPFCVEMPASRRGVDRL